MTVKRSKRRCFLKLTFLRPWQTRTHRLPTQMFPRLPTRATFVADTNFVSGTQKKFLILFRNILCPQQMFPSLRSSRNIMGNNVSSFTRAALFASRRAQERDVQTAEIQTSLIASSRRSVSWGAERKTTRNNKIKQHEIIK